MDDGSKLNLFVVVPDEEQPLLAQIEQAMEGKQQMLGTLPTLTNIALGDPYLAQQLVDLHQSWEVRPLAARGLLARLRTRLAWWLSGPELRQVNATHATLVRLIDSLIVQLDQERAARRRIEEHLAMHSEQS